MGEDGRQAKTGSRRNRERGGCHARSLPLRSHSLAWASCQKLYSPRTRQYDLRVSSRKLLQSIGCPMRSTGAEGVRRATIRVLEEQDPEATCKRRGRWAHTGGAQEVWYQEVLGR